MDIQENIIKNSGSISQLSEDGTQSRSLTKYLL